MNANKDVMSTPSSLSFAEYLNNLDVMTPIADSFGDRENLSKDYPAKSLHEVQKNHIVYWFRSKGSEAAEKVYNRLRDPAMLLWIAERVNVNCSVIEAAANDVGGTYMSKDFVEKCKKTGSTLSGEQARIIREQIPWCLIANNIQYL